jgi:hypothetical protein
MNSSYIKMWKLKKDRENEEKYDWWCVCVDVLLVNQLDIKNTYDWWCVCVGVLLVNQLDIKNTFRHFLYIQTLNEQFFSYILARTWVTFDEMSLMSALY